MKVLMINVVCGIRSTGRICTDLAAVLEEQGHEVKIAYGREEVPEQFQKYAVRIGNNIDVKLHGVKARLADGAGYGSRRSTRKFIDWVKAYDPDVIHLHNLHGYYLNIEILFEYLKVCGKRIIWTLHDCWAFTGHSAYCDAIQCERWKTGCYACPQKKEYPKSLLDFSKKNWVYKRKIFLGVPDLEIITPSKWLAGLVKESFLKKYPVRVIHNGIDTEHFKPLENDFKLVQGIQNKKMVLGVATAWNEMKGLADFYELANRLGKDYQVVLVGLTEQQQKQIPKNILGLKRTTSVKELAYIYSAADVFLNLSYCETYPTVNLEVRACGTPIITYRTGGSTESAGSKCVIVERGDMRSLVEAVRKITDKRNYEKYVDETDAIDKWNFEREYTMDYMYDKLKIGPGYWRKKSELGLSGKYVILGVAAIWDKRKGLDDFIELEKDLPQNCQLVLVGLNTTQKKEMSNNIICLEKTSNVEELSEIYAIADVFVNPTYEDNYPTTNLEAISCGTPVITYDTGGSPESANDFGVVVKKGDKEELLRVIDILIDGQMSVCQSSSLNNMRKESMLKKYLQIFEEI